MHTSSCWFTLLRGPGALLLIFLYCLLFGGGSEAALVNRTIDDAFGDSQTGQRPPFLPAVGVWDDQTCSGCAIRPDVNKAFRNTYTSATYNPGLGSVNFTLDFQGTAIYVFFILANNAGDGITTITNCTFKLDGQNVGSFLHEPDLTTTEIQFNALVFSKTGIPFGDHRLVVATEGLSFNAYINFDYALYTFDDEPLPSSTTTIPVPSSPVTPSIPPQPSSTLAPHQSDESGKHFIVGAIAGSIIGGLACLAIIGILYWFYWRCKKITPRINLLGTSDDVPGSKGEGLPIYQTNRRGTPTEGAVQTFTAGTSFLSGLPPRTGSPPLSRTEELPEYNTVIHTPHTQATRLNTFLHVANPGPESPPRGQVNVVQQDGLKEQLIKLHEEHESLMAILGSTDQKQCFLTDSGQAMDGDSMANASIAELRKEIEFLTDQIADMRAQQLVQKSPDGSPPGYTISTNNPTDIPVFLVRKVQ